MRECGALPWGRIAAVLALLAGAACVPLPVQVAPAVQGTVVDADSGEPLSGALVVVRFEGRYDDTLPDRELIGHREAWTDERGAFRIERWLRPGLSAWPLFRAEGRVVGAMREGYRCGEPRMIGPARRVRIELEPALDAADRRDSCRPVAAERGAAPAYTQAWRALHPELAPRPPEPRDRQLERVLEARRTLGFGENCEGPVADLALSPGGRWAAWAELAPGGSRIAVADLARAEVPGVSQAPFGPLVRHEAGVAAAVPPRRLAWSRGDELVLWEPSSPADRSSSASIFSPQRLEAFWRPAPDPVPAAPLPGLAHRAPRPAASGGVRRVPLDPEDLNDEDDARWRGRAFSLAHELAPDTGLPSDVLEVRRADGHATRLALPGEVCGPRGRFGRPHFRITADGGTALDLRFVDGGCHVVGIDLASGEWSRLDTADAPAVCSAQRRVPATHLRTALRGWVREVEAAVVAAGADPQAAYVVRLSEAGTARVETRGFDGRPRRVDAPDFPVATPLRRIHVSVLGAAAGGPGRAPAAIPGPQPL